ncbi:cxxc-type zinc finger protein 1 [Holotrichia oblita]|uniref:Cxxc-type zinc finger protein 1 n=1 Tax=Holotrichia oblita TaxID=644536 RepID=A0ACB9SKT1_HOLOL|nr:cxxc-type zinc finger protein 1 [Holotrichia oblita]
MKRHVDRRGRPIKVPKRFEEFAMLTCKEAKNGPDKDLWKKAIEEEKEQDPVSNQWNPGKVIENADKPRSYNVLNDPDHTIQRNTRDLKSSLNEPTIKDEESFERLNQSSNGASRNGINISLQNIKCPPLERQTTTTRCGRSIKLPSKFTDYEL